MDEKKEDFLNSNDWFLQNLVEMTNNSSGGFLGVTLNVGGYIISGILAPGRDYFENLAKSFEDTLKSQGYEDTAVVMGKYFSQYSEIYEDSKKEEDPKLPTFIHLKDARFFIPGQKPFPVETFWWRGRISRVDGFIIGLMKEGEPPK